MKRLLAMFLVSASVLVMAACGGSGGDSKATSTAGSQPTTGGGSATAASSASAPASSATTAASPSVAATSGPTSAASTTAVATLPAGGTTPVTTQPVPANATGQAVLKDVRAGVHPETSSERVVFEFTGSLPAARIEYITTARQCASGLDVTITGGGVLSVVFTNAVAHDQSGKVTVTSQSIAGGGQPVTEAKQTCDFEGQVAWAIGAKGKQNFVVSQLADPPRLVIDFKQ